MEIRGFVQVLILVVMEDSLGQIEFERKELAKGES